jgi:hypothetical protein
MQYREGKTYIAEVDGRRVRGSTAIVDGSGSTVALLELGKKWKVGVCRQRVSELVWVPNIHHHSSIYLSTLANTLSSRFQHPPALSDLSIRSPYTTSVNSLHIFLPYNSLYLTTHRTWCAAQPTLTSLQTGRVVWSGQSGSSTRAGLITVS